jgi:formylglycine-generating enzyme required for sulfatase activity
MATGSHGKTLSDPWPVAAALAAACLLSIFPGCRPSTPRTAPPGATASPSAAVSQEITTPSGVEMVLIPGGTMTMGSGAAVDAQPVHEVAVGGFYMDRFEVTQELYEKVMGANPARRKDPQSPVERVRWLDAVKFCNARSAQEGLEPCYDLESRRCRFEADGYRLPTEAEWEYACRGGTGGDYYFGDDPRELDAHAWCKANARRRPHPVGEKRANPFGLFDMSGNVWEWCNDWYEVDCYAKTPPGEVDPPGPAEGEKKVLRGGAFSSTPESCSSWTRYCDEPGFADACVASDDYGFRCVRKAAAGR